MPTKEDLKYFQSMPLDIKVAMTKTRIREWVNHFGESGTYISFSGGKDSTVLLHLVRELYPDIPAVFVNTGLEYPEIQSFVKSFDNVKVLYPKMPFTEVIRKYGYPFISKNVSQDVWEARTYENCLRTRSKFDPDSEYNQKYGTKFSQVRWKALLETDFKISHMCCKIMKKSPAKKYEKSEDRTPIVGTLAEESQLRTTQWLKNGCNAFEATRNISQPMSFWTESDVLQYIHENNIQIASVYGEIIHDEPQLNMLEDVPCKCRMSGCDRTGCIFCGFGAHLKEESRFKRLKETHPKQYNYCIGGENMTLTDCGFQVRAA